MEKVADKLNEIISIYLDNNFSKDYLIGAEQKNQVKVHEATFRTYFKNGKLNYLEQELNPVLRMFLVNMNKLAA